MGISERKQKEKDLLKMKIVAAAKELFLEEGYEKVSMRKIAARIEYSPTTIYLYFKNKSDLIVNIVQDYYIDLAKDVIKVLKNDDKPLQQLTDILVLYVQKSIDPKNHYKLIMAHYHDIKKAAGSGSGYPRGFSELKDLVEQCMEDGSFRKDDSDLVLQGIWMNNYGIISMLLTEVNFPWVDKERLIKHTIKTYLKGHMN